MIIQTNDVFFNTFDSRIAAITVSIDGTINYISGALCKILGYDKDELLGSMISKIMNPVVLSEEVRLISLANKNGLWIDFKAVISKDLQENAFSIVCESLDNKYAGKDAREFEIALNESENRKDFLHTILDEQRSIIIVAQLDMLIDVNKAFLEFYDVPSLEYFLDHVSQCIGDTFEEKEGNEYLLKDVYGEYWINYVLDHPHEVHKALIRGCVFDVHITKISQSDDDLYVITLNDITALEKAQVYMADSIEYAALIQHSLVPDNDLFRRYVSEYFVIWHPKDVVGGDIYLLQELRNPDEMMLMVIDCAGHGVPGAFVTMLVKAIERQIVGRIINSDEKVSPAKFLQIFNRSMKHLLKQESRESISNAGFDGGILYYNRAENKMIYAGAKTPLYVMQGGKLDIIPGNRHSIGYKRSNPDYEFTDYEIKIEDDTLIYLATDGYVDQQGEADGLSLGKEKLIELIKEYSNESLADQQEVFLDALMEHRGERNANDDVTMVCLKFLHNLKGN